MTPRFITMAAIIDKQILHWKLNCYNNGTAIDDADVVLHSDDGSGGVATYTTNVKW